MTFYTLSAMSPEAASPAASLRAVAVGPVTLPELVDRPQLVIRVAADRVDIVETERWAEPLKSEIPRLLAENLARLLRPARVSTIDQSESRDAEYRVLVDIQRFESVSGGRGGDRRALVGAPQRSRSGSEKGALPCAGAGRRHWL